MKKTRTRFILERHSITIQRAVPERTPVNHSMQEVFMLLPEASYSHPAGRFSKKVTVPIGFVIWLAISFLVDLLVQQIFPVPEDLRRHGSLNEIIASRPTAAVALNLFGQLIGLVVIACIATRLTRRRPRRAGLIITSIVMILAVVNTLLTQNFRWPVAVGVALVPLVGYCGTRLGQPNLSEDHDIAS